jgi:SAM-dependent methyltransferase
MNQLVNPEETYDSYSCPLCGAVSVTVIYQYNYEARLFPLYQCGICTGLFIRPMPIGLIDERKMDSLVDAELISPFFRKLHETFILQKEVRIVRAIIGKSQIELLDIGCGSGCSTDFWRRQGFSVEGVEASQTRCEFARANYGLTVHNCYVEELALTKKYDVIVLRHIIEHLENPSTIIKNVTKLLHPDGVLLLIVPNIDCIGKRLFGRYWEWVLPWHCNFFTPSSLQSLVEQCEYTVCSTYQSPSPFYYAESLGRALRSTKLEQFFSRYRVAGLPISLPLAALGLFTGKADNLTLIARQKD